MKAQLALYKGPPRNDVWHSITHYAIRLWTWSRWSHVELVIDGVCYSSSARDGGIRAKVIDLDSGRWDVVDLPLFDSEIATAKRWFIKRAGAGYDWLGIARFVAPFLGHDKKRYVCFESVAAALGLGGAHKLTANDLHDWAVERLEYKAAIDAA